MCFLPIFVEFLQDLFLGGTQIVLDALLVNRDQANLCRRRDVEVNHPHAAAFAFSLDRPANFAQSAGLLNQGACSGISEQKALKQREFIIA
jgi:hypothetical protein